MRFVFCGFPALAVFTAIFVGCAGPVRTPSIVVRFNQLAAPEVIPVGTTTRLNVGESAIVPIWSRNPANSTELHVSPGELYRFFVLPDQTWTDWFITCQSDGYQTHTSLSPQELAQSSKILPVQNWFVLCGAIDRPGVSTFVIGRVCTRLIDRGGKLILFANDATFAYWNNFGKIWVLVTRIR